MSASSIGSDIGIHPDIWWYIVPGADLLSRIPVWKDPAPPVARKIEPGVWEIFAIRYILLTSVKQDLICIQNESECSEESMNARDWLNRFHDLCDKQWKPSVIVEAEDEDIGYYCSGKCFLGDDNSQSYSWLPLTSCEEIPFPGTPDEDIPCSPISSSFNSTLSRIERSDIQALSIASMIGAVPINRSVRLLILNSDVQREARRLFYEKKTKLHSFDIPDVSDGLAFERSQVSIFKRIDAGK